jgi:hypothetical protein
LLTTERSAEFAIVVSIQLFERIRNGTADIGVTYITPVHHMKKYWALLFLFITAISCYRPQPYIPHKVAGYKAVYSSDPELKKVSFISSQTMSSPGKIYVK